MFASLDWLDIALMIPVMIISSYFGIESLNLFNFWLKLKRKNIQKYKTKDTWAIVTGSSDGLGKCFVNELAKAGYNVLLISRNADKLKTVSEEIAIKYKVKTKVIAIDFTNKECMKTLQENQIWRSTIDTKDVGVLINNVGINVKFPKYLEEITDDELENIINVNVLITSKLTKLMVQKMLKRDCKSAIVSMGSSSGTTPTSLLSIYAASKSFINNFMESLSNEHPDKIDFLSVNLGTVKTTMTAVKKASLMVPEPENIIKAALMRVGVSTNTNPYWVHRIMDILGTSGLTKSLYMKMVAGMSKKIREKAMKKLCKEE